MKVINVDERIKKAIVNSTMEFFKVPKELFTRHKECKKYYQPFLKELKKNRETILKLLFFKKPDFLNFLIIEAYRIQSANQNNSWN